MTEYTFEVIGIDTDWDHNGFESWNVTGKLTIKGDTYDTTYHHEVGEYGECYTEILLDGIYQNGYESDTYVARQGLTEIVEELSAIRLFQAFDAEKKAFAEYLDSIKGIVTHDSLDEAEV